MKKSALIAFLVAAVSLTANAGNGKKKGKAKEQAKTECCKKSTCSGNEKQGCCEKQPTCCIKKS